MNDDQRAILEVESAKGEEMNRVFDTYIQPFCDAKRAQFFEAFQNCDSNNEDQLVKIRLGLGAIESLVMEFAEPIRTGKLARHSLATEEENNGK